MWATATRLPSCTALCNGVMLRTLVDAVMQAGFPRKFSGTVIWDGPGAVGLWAEGDGAIGEIVCSPEGLVGAFYDKWSPRNPFLQENRPLRLERVWPFLELMPPAPRRLVPRSLLRRFDVNAGVPPAERILTRGPLPIVTAVFWCF